MTVAMLVIAVLTSSATAEEKAKDSSIGGNIRLLLHGTNGDGPIVLSGWLIGANLTQDPNKWFVAVGPQLNGKNWWADFNAGALITKTSIAFVPEIRAAYTGEKYSFFTNLQWIDPGHSTQGGYLFLQANRIVVKDIRLGLETENTWKQHGTKALSVGPQLVFSFGKVTYTVSYQFASQGKRHLWIRTALSF